MCIRDRLYRYSYELDDVEEKFFREIGNLFFPTLEMKSVPKSRGLYVKKGERR